MDAGGQPDGHLFIDGITDGSEHRMRLDGPAKTRRLSRPFWKSFSRNQDLRGIVQIEEFGIPEGETGLPGRKSDRSERRDNRLAVVVDAGKPGGAQALRRLN